MIILVKYSCQLNDQNLSAGRKVLYYLNRGELYIRHLILINDINKCTLVQPYFA